MFICPDVQYLVLSYVDGYELPNCRSVCKLWDVLIRKHDLWEELCRIQCVPYHHTALLNLLQLTEWQSLWLHLCHPKCGKATSSGNWVVNQRIARLFSPKLRTLQAKQAFSVGTTASFEREECSIVDGWGQPVHVFGYIQHKRKWNSALHFLASCYRSVVQYPSEVEFVNTVTLPHAIETTWVQKGACEHFTFEDDTTLPHSGVPCKIPSECTAKKCDVSENLWICLHCGHTACGRPRTAQYDNTYESLRQKCVYGNGHALDHFTKTYHPCCVKLNVDTEGEYHCYVCNKEIIAPEAVAARLKALGVDIPEVPSALTRQEHEFINMGAYYMRLLLDEGMPDGECIECARFLPQRFVEVVGSSLNKKLKRMVLLESTTYYALFSSIK